MLKANTINSILNHVQQKFGEFDVLQVGSAFKNVSDCPR
jgi:hypothetical protein